MKIFQGKAKTVLAGAVAVIVIFGLGASLFMNFKMNKGVGELEKLTKELSKQISEGGSASDKSDGDDYDEEGWDEGWEDGDGYGEVEYEEGDYYHENGELIVIGGEYKIRDFDYIAQAYLKDDESLLKSDADRETLELAKAVLDECVKDDMTAYEKELAIHDWICENVSFDGDSLSAMGSASRFMDTPYGALKYKMAVCVGYASTFRLLTTMAGLECDIIHDIEYSHTWNIIKLDDGEYYLVDVYSDVTDGESCIHSYFNCNEEGFPNSWDVERYPRANGRKYSYAAMNSVEISSLDEIYKKAIEMSEKTGELYFTYDGDCTQSDILYVLDGIVTRINNNTPGWADNNVSENENGEDVYTLFIYVYDDDEFGENFVPDDMTIDTEEVDEYLDSVFGAYDVDGEFYSEEYMDEENYAEYDYAD